MLAEAAADGLIRLLRRCSGMVFVQLSEHRVFIVQPVVQSGTKAAECALCVTAISIRRIQTPEEREWVSNDIEAAVVQLEREGLIDPLRIGISGWSQAGFFTDYLLIHSPIRSAVATHIDGSTSLGTPIDWLFLLKSDEVWTRRSSCSTRIGNKDVKCR